MSWPCLISGHQHGALHLQFAGAMRGTDIMCISRDHQAWNRGLKTLEKASIKNVKYSQWGPLGAVSTKGESTKLGVGKKKISDLSGILQPVGARR